MSKMQFYSLYDSKAQAYGRPFTVNSKGEAIRSFITVLEDSNTPVGRHPADFNLFYLGEFDQLSGMLLPIPSPENLGNGLEFKPQVKQRTLFPDTGDASEDGFKAD